MISLSLLRSTQVGHVTLILREDQTTVLVDHLPPHESQKRVLSYISKMAVVMPPSIVTRVTAVHRASRSTD